MRRPFILLLIFGFIQGQQRSSSSGNVTALRDLEFEQIKLSYIQTDRALAVLKTLGYAVVEFKAGKGEISGENNFTPVFSNKNTNLNAPGALPIIIKLPDSENISLVEKSTSKSSSKKSALGVDLGGVILDNTTSGEPMQRLLVGYMPGDYRPMARLRDLIQNEIDIPASQIAIEALVIEINTDNLNELGVDFTSSGPITASFPPPQGGSISPFTVVLDRTLLGTTSNFRANMEALVSAKKAEILSKPSALVLDGRQARIQVGQQIPTGI